MKNSFNFFSSTTGIVVTGLILGLIAVFLQFSGNPGNMGICVVCFNRDIAAAVGLPRAPIVQYLRPEIMGMVLGSLAAALCFGEYRARGGSAPAVRFLLGVIAAIGALVFLGCPWRVIMRLAGGDANALFGLAGLVVGIGLGTVFFRMGFSLGRSQSQSKASGLILPGIMLALVAVYLFNPPMEGQPQNGVLFYSLKGPGSMHAPFLLSLGAGLLVGFLAQRSRFCTMGAVRDVLLCNQWHLALGFLAVRLFRVKSRLAPFLATGFEAGMLGYALFALLFRDESASRFAIQLFRAGEGDNDAAVFVVGLIVGAACAHNFGMASSTAGIGPNGMLGALGGLAVCLLIGFFNCKRGA